MQIFNGLLLMHNDKFVPHHYSCGTINELHQIFVKYSCVDQHLNIIVAIIPCLYICLQVGCYSHPSTIHMIFFAVKMISIWHRQSEKLDP
jgi:hypothetical protein